MQIIISGSFSLSYMYMYSVLIQEAVVKMICLVSWRIWQASKSFRSDKVTKCVVMEYLEWSQRGSKHGGRHLNHSLYVTSSQQHQVKLVVCIMSRLATTFYINHEI